MSRPVLYRGQIVREKAHKDPIGPWCFVDKVHYNLVYLSTDEGFNKIVFITKIYIPKIYSLCVSEEIYRRLCNKELYCVSHRATPAWRNLLNKKIDIIRFYTRMGYEAYFVFDSIHECNSLGEKVIKIVVDYKIK